MDCIAIIPARFASARFPGKLLASLAGQPLIQHVVESVSRVEGIDATIVATDDERIAEAARECGADVVLSVGEFASGTDRVADAASRYSADIIVNVQGDELLLDPAEVTRALNCFRGSGTELGTLRAPLKERRDFWDPNAVKVVINDNEQALYFSRAAVPFARAEWEASVDMSTGEPNTAWTPKVVDQTSTRGAWLHLGVYFYLSEALRRWAALPPSRLEKAEGLEQLRVLEAGETIQTYLVNEGMPGVNTPGDLERVRALFREHA
jgi:3-deoxy-manno-octulosonate cytidylyltransferase (CMP-KDO synthetase)